MPRRHPGRAGGSRRDGPRPRRGAQRAAPRLSISSSISCRTATWVAARPGGSQKRSGSREGRRRGPRASSLTMPRLGPRLAILCPERSSRARPRRQGTAGRLPLEPRHRARWMREEPVIEGVGEFESERRALLVIAFVKIPPATPAIRAAGDPSTLWIPSSAQKRADQVRTAARVRVAPVREERLALEPHPLEARLERLEVERPLRPRFSAATPPSWLGASSALGSEVGHGEPDDAAVGGTGREDGKARQRGLAPAAPGGERGGERSARSADFARRRACGVGTGPARERLLLLRREVPPGPHANELQHVASAASTFSGSTVCWPVPGCGISSQEQQRAACGHGVDQHREAGRPRLLEENGARSPRASPSRRRRLVAVVHTGAASSTIVGFPGTGAPFPP